MMGFRSTFVTEDCVFPWPEWFRDKYADSIMFGRDASHEKAKYGCAIASRREFKTYHTFTCLEDDIQKVMIEADHEYSKRVRLVWLHECGGITLVYITREKIIFQEPHDFWEVDDCAHSYCYGCSDPKGALDA